MSDKPYYGTSNASFGSMNSGSFLTSAWTDIEKFLGLNGQTTANTAGMNPTQATWAKGAAVAQNIGALTAVFGSINSAVGSFYAAKAQQAELKSQASTLQFQSGMDAINAHGAEMNAQSIQEASKTQVQQYTMRAAQETAQSQVSTAQRGVDLSSGSAVSERASAALVKDMDVLTINANATRAAWAQRTEATNFSNRSLLEGVSANNMTASANSISPGSAFATSLLGGATKIAGQWDYRRKLALAGASSYAPSFVPQGWGQ